MTEDGDLPDGTASGPMTFEEGVSALESILERGPEDQTSAKTVQTKENTPADEGEDLPDGTDADEEGAGNDPEDQTDDEPTGEEDEGESTALALTDDLEIDLGNGTKATLGDLKRDYGAIQKRVADFQRDYTKKSQEVSEAGRQVSEHADRIYKTAQQIVQERDAVIAYTQKYMPQPPQRPQLPPAEDPFGWTEYMAAKESYDAFAAEFYGLQQQSQQAKQRAEQERAEKLPEVLKAEKEKLIERHPSLKDPAKARQVREELVDAFEREYGVPAEELGMISDSRYVMVMLDALEHIKFKTAQSKVHAKVANKPPVAAPGKRRTLDSATAKRMNAQKEFNRTKSLDAAVNLLAGLDL